VELTRIRFGEYSCDVIAGVVDSLVEPENEKAGAQPCAPTEKSYTYDLGKSAKSADNCT
jgi:hypothetical protein